MIRTHQASRWVMGAAGAAAVGAAVIAGTASPAPVSAATSIVGAGSTFDLPFFNKAFPIYDKNNSGVSVNYQGIGSGGGIKQFTNNTVDFGATDVPMNSSELSAASKTGSSVVQIPVALGGVAIAYNLPEVGSKVLKLDSSTLANIFLGKVTKWNDSSIKALNPSLSLPDLAILTVHRSDASGTNYITTNYLSSVSSDWKNNIGTGKSVQWPSNSEGGKGNPGVSAAIKQHTGAIGYVELAYALDNNIPFIQLKNRDGAYLFPTQNSVKAAASQFPNVSYKNFSIVNASGKMSYPIAGYSWVLLRQQPKNNAAALVNLMKWTVTSGQSYASGLNYVALPSNVQQEALNELKTVKTS
jgi:phosphate transport system substrate-binding protein